MGVHEQVAIPSCFSPFTQPRYKVNARYDHMQCLWSTHTLHIYRIFTLTLSDFADSAGRYWCFMLHPRKYIFGCSVLYTYCSIGSAQFNFSRRSISRIVSKRENYTPSGKKKKVMIVIKAMLRKATKVHVYVQSFFPSLRRPPEVWHHSWIQLSLKYLQLKGQAWEIIHWGYTGPNIYELDLWWHRALHWLN